MNWQEYQNIVGDMYKEAEGIGSVKKNITLPDKITGQLRQIDALIEIKTKGHVLRVIIDAKFYKKRVDVKKVEEVIALADAVGAHHSILVASNGWTKPAEIKAGQSRIDLRLVSIEEAVEHVSDDVWKLCAVCENDCVIMDQDGAAVLNGGVLWWLAGQCRECNSGRVWCQDCGERFFIRSGKSAPCRCGHNWRASKSGITIEFQDPSKVSPIFHPAVS